MTAKSAWSIQAFITIVVSWCHLFSKRWWNGDTENNFFLNLFFQNICKALESVSNINNKNIITNGTKIPILIFSKYNNEASNHHIAKAQLSHIKIFAGNILKNIKDAKMAVTMTTNVVAIYVWFTSVIAHKTKNMIAINPHANQSSQSIILIALTILIVIKNVIIG